MHLWDTSPKLPPAFYANYIFCSVSKNEQTEFISHVDELIKNEWSFRAMRVGGDP